MMVNGKYYLILFQKEKYKIQGSKALKKYYNAVIEHNLEMLEDVQNIGIKKRNSLFVG